MKLFGRPIAAVSTYTHVLHKRSTEGEPTNYCCQHTHVFCRRIQSTSQVKVLNIQQLWQANCCCEHTHTCVLQKQSIEGCTQGSRVGQPIAAVGIHMCVSEYTHVWCRKSQLKLCQFKKTVGKAIAAVSTYTHVLQKETTHVCCRISQLRVASKDQGLADQLLLCAYTCVLLNTHMSGADQVN